MDQFSETFPNNLTANANFPSTWMDSSKLFPRREAHGRKFHQTLLLLFKSWRNSSRSKRYANKDFLWEGLFELAVSPAVPGKGCRISEEWRVCFGSSKKVAVTVMFLRHGGKYVIQRIHFTISFYCLAVCILSMEVSWIVIESPWKFIDCQDENINQKI